MAAASAAVTCWASTLAPFHTKRLCPTPNSGAGSCSTVSCVRASSKEVGLDENESIRRRMVLVGIGASLASIPVGFSSAEVNQSTTVGTEVPKGFRAFVDRVDGYSYYYPADWRDFDFLGHDSAFKDRNVSLQHVRVNFIPTEKSDIRDLGPKEEVIPSLVKNVYAAPIQMPTIFDIQERSIDGKDYWTFEYLLTSPNFARTAFATIGIGNGRYYTLVVGANERRWKRVRSKLKIVRRRKFKGVDLLDDEDYILVDNFLNIIGRESFRSKKMVRLNNILLPVWELRSFLYDCKISQGLLNIVVEMAKELASEYKFSGHIFLNLTEGYSVNVEKSDQSVNDNADIVTDMIRNERGDVASVRRIVAVVKCEIYYGLVVSDVQAKSVSLKCVVTQDESDIYKMFDAWTDVFEQVMENLFPLPENKEYELFDVDFQEGFTRNDWDSGILTIASINQELTYHIRKIFRNDVTNVKVLTAAKILRFSEVF